jgi:phosphoribosylaminoimidazolecarboxamide formyltransferase/IMP cyclohydrolase
MSQTVKYALISVSDKTNLIVFAQGLIQQQFKILSTGGTYKHLSENNIAAIEVASVTNFPEILDGRVKTLHPKIHGGILAKKDDKRHQEQLKQHNINAIDLVCVNLYPFENTINQANCTFNAAIENIDIGGPTMIRAAAKNHESVIVVTDYNDYDSILQQLHEHNNIASSTRIELAQKAFAHTAYYDSLISNYLSKFIPFKFNQEFTFNGKLSQVLRYGENSHQQSAFYKDSGNLSGLLSSFEQIQGKELSYNNLADADTAWECVKQFTQPSCVIVKHANPCGVASSDSAFNCYKKAYASDTISSFGGIIAFNVEVDKNTILEVCKQFCELLIAPNFTADAIAAIKSKPNIRVLKISLGGATNKFEYKRIGGGLLVQTPENKSLHVEDIKIVSNVHPNQAMMDDMLFAWKVARFVKSNAIVLVKNNQTIGIGAGQMSRIDSTKIAMNKAQEFGFTVAGSAAASDAFFPFRDNVDLLAKGGVTAIIQPGGSVKDQEVLKACNEHNIAMILSGYRAFRH